MPLFRKTRFLRPVDKNCDYYSSEDGWTMKREWGRTPNGNPINGCWVLRNERGEWIDLDQYRHDITERNGFKIEYER